MKRVGALLAVVCATAIGCGSDDADPDASTSAGATSTQAADRTGPFVATPLRLTLEGTPMGIVVNDTGVFISDFGAGNVVQGTSSGIGDASGRIVLLEHGGAEPAVLLSEAGAPTEIGVGPDGSVYFVDETHSDQVMKLPAGAPGPTPIDVDVTVDSIVAAGDTGEIYFTENLKVSGSSKPVLRSRPCT
ncbi:MAG: hypothetical protein ACSLE6_02985 [Mycobacterium sp.]